MINNMLNQRAEQMLKQVQLNNPALYNQALEMTQGKSQEEIKQLVNNMAMNKGVDLTSLISSIF